MAGIHCPVCGSIYVEYYIADLSNPHPDAYNIEIWGKTYRQLGISGKGRWMIYKCSHVPEAMHIWAVLEERYPDR